VLLLILAPAAMLVGLYGRFKGIGSWPLGVDEFYTSRSVDHVLLTGWPRFPCGGYYTRGVLFQYLVAGLRLSGLSPEFAGRFLCAASSVAVWPAVYLIARRIQGSIPGWMVVILLALSVWEIEMARFLRMYAPFQAIFVWYVVFYLRYIVDRDTAALRWMIGLSVFGVLTWEGGALLGVANLLAIVQTHEHGRLKSADWARVAGLLGLLGLLILVARDWSGIGQATAATAASTPTSHLPFAIAWSASLRQHPLWAGVFLLPVGIAVGSLRWIWSRRRDWLVAAGLCVALAGAAGHAFTFSAGVLALMLLLGLIDWRELSAPAARWFLLALGAFFAFWFAYSQLSGSWSGDAGLRIVSRVALPAPYHHLFGYPDVYDDILLPWARAVPILSLELALAIAFAFWRVIAAASKKQDPSAVLLGLLLVMVMVVGATPTPRVETRYSFFLYPLVIVLAATAVAAVAQSQRLIRHRYAPLLALAPLAFFVATEDFNPRHLIKIDTAEANFRVGMPAALAEHYYPRNDMRGVARWLAANVQPGDIVIAGIPSLDEYYGDFNYFYMDADDARYEDTICPDGRTDRWTSHPILRGVDSLKPLLAAGHPVYATVYTDTEQQLRKEAALAGWRITRAWTAADGRTDVLRIVANST
jgi:hypothetical protein